MQQIQTKPAQRVEWVDVAKGLGILTVVYAHALAPFQRYIYFFHMPLFFLLSGYLYRSKGTVKEYAWRKVKSLYIPFVGWNFVITLIQLIAKAVQRGKLTIGMVSKSAAFMGQVLLTLKKDGTYLGATWFLGALFVISILYKLGDKVFEGEKYNRWYMMAIFGATSLLGLYFKFEFALSRPLMLMFFFALGALWKEHEDVVKPLFKLPVVIWGFGLFGVIAHESKITAISGRYTNRGMFLIAACLGSLVLIYVAMWLCKMEHPFFVRCKEILQYWGKNSIDIVIWQFIAFRFVVLLQLALEGEPLGQWLTVDSRYNTSGLWWVAYTIAGMLIPLLWGKILRAGIWGKALKKIHLV